MKKNVTYKFKICNFTKKIFVCMRYETLHLLFDVGYEDEHSVEIRKLECDVLSAVIQERNPNPNPKSNPNRYRFIEN